MKPNIIIKITDNNICTEEALKIIEDAKKIRQDVFIKQGRKQECIFDEHDEDENTIFLTCYIQEEEEWKPIASMRSYIEISNNKKVGRNSKIAVTEEYRNSGSKNIKDIAKYLFQAAENTLISNLDAPKDLEMLALPSAVKFYKNQGYSGNETPIFDENEPEFPVVILTKILPTELSLVPCEIHDLIKISRERMISEIQAPTC